MLEDSTQRWNCFDNACIVSMSMTFPKLNAIRSLDVYFLWLTCFAFLYTWRRTSKVESYWNYHIWLIVDHSIYLCTSVAGSLTKDALTFCSHFAEKLEMKDKVLAELRSDFDLKQQTDEREMHNLKTTYYPWSWKQGCKSQRANLSFLQLSDSWVKFGNWKQEWEA